MKSILLIVDPYLPIPPDTYGGVERVAAMLIEGLAAKDWNITLAAHPKSDRQKVRLIPLKASPGKLSGRIYNALHVASHILTRKFDIIHSLGHIDLTAAFWPWIRHRIIHTFGFVPQPHVIPKRLNLMPSCHVHFTVCGEHMVPILGKFAPTTAIHNGVPVSSYDFQATVPKDAPLVFLGRLEAIKGTHHAIRLAKITGRKLVIAGNISNKPDARTYFKTEVEPHLSDQITYIGPVNDAQKNTLLGKAAALLMPIEWDEPFGIVMAEALACGTPVIGIARGAVPEVVDDGITGAGCNTFDEMAEAIRHVDKFSREQCRLQAERRFAHEVIVDKYIALYEKLLSQA